MNIVNKIKSIIKKLFGHTDTVKMELKQIYSSINHIKPPYYSFHKNLLQPNLANKLYLFAKTIKPLMDFADRTIAHPDSRTSRLYFNYLIDMEISPEALLAKENFTYDAIKMRLENSIMESDEQKNIDAEFKTFIKHIDDLSSAKINIALDEVERFIDICRYDWERLIKFFDQNIDLNNSSYSPHFMSYPAEYLALDLGDVYCLFKDFVFSDSLCKQLACISNRYTQIDISEASKKIDKIFLSLNKILEHWLNPLHILAIAQLSKGDPSYIPNIAIPQINYVEDYRKNLINKYERDTTQILKEMHENTMTKNIKSLFYDISLIPVNGYNEETNEYLMRETLYRFTYVKALGILKTFAVTIFEKQIREFVKRILVEGFFDNKIFQTKIANIVYQCERITPRIEAFETTLKTNQRLSISSIKRYVDEMRHGKDITQLLKKVIDEINYMAKSICDDEVGLFTMLANILDELLVDSKKTSPDLVANIRNLGGLHNKEMINTLAVYKSKLLMLETIMLALLKN